MMADISFSAVQARHNAGFLCGENGEEPCFTKADVMLVLDRSGSINSTELGELKTAAKAFVDALALSADGAHAGEVSFATTASLDAHLTDNGAVVKAVIDALASGGFTNLKDAIDLAAGELENPGDGHDRSDVDSPDIIVIITDGNPNRPEAATAAAEAVAAATAAKAAGATIYVVGVGNDVDTAYLRDEIATSPAHYFEAADFASLSEELEDIAACPNGD
jgi:Mg-chelatase subunit ChlD